MAVDAGVIVVGGGWAGLAAAVHLARNGRPVTLLEAAPQLGGRARRVSWNGCNIDNGQHLLLGACTATLELLRELGVAPERVLQRLPLRLVLNHTNGERFELTAAPLPAPWHLAVALLRARGFTRAERWAALRMSLRLVRTRFQLEVDMSVADWLQRCRQPARVRAAIWEPLCLAVLNTPPAVASAEVFLRVLRESFGGSRAASELLLTATDLSGLLPDAAQRYLETRGATIRLGLRAQRLLTRDGGVCGVAGADGHEYSGDVVLAVPPYAAAALLEPQARAATLIAELRHFSYEPICTVYLQYPPEVALPEPMFGLLNATTQWVFDRRVGGQSGLLAAVISGPGEHMALDGNALGAHVSAELARAFPHWPRPLAIRVIREKRATFSCRVGINRERPGHRTPLPGCWLAGDYTATSYPATLEGAVQSGIECARQICNTSVWSADHSDPVSAPSDTD